MDRVKRAYLGYVLQGFTGINELLLAVVIANLLSFCGYIRGHFLDDSDALRFDFLEALHQLKQPSTISSPAQS